MTWRLFSLGMLAGCALISAGCSGGGSETASGKVTLDGAPLPAVYLSLIPKNPEVKGPFIARTDDQGQFSFGTIDKPESGVPAGAYTLSMTTAHNEVADEGTPTPPQKIPPPHSTGIDFEVLAGGTSDANFELKSK
jgi:hypothetical protein